MTADSALVANPPPTATRTPTAAPAARGAWLTDWRVEDPEFWRSTGRRIARRNLIASVVAEHVGFSVWALWSVVAVTLPVGSFPFLADVDKRFWLVALPNLVGAIMRLPYTVAVTRFGGRNWTVVSALLLTIPVALGTYCVTHPGTPYWFFLLAAATAGLGGGNFASSMTNISFFYPERVKGTALGINAAGGNIGLSTVQFVVPTMIFFSVGTAVAVGIWLPIVLATALTAALAMNNLDVTRSTLSQQLAAVRRPQAWVMSVLYLGTFGSFLGFSAAFPAVLQYVFPSAQKMHFLGTALLLPVSFLGPLVGSLARPVGGWIADRFGGARVTAVVFALMAAGSLAAVKAADAHAFGPFVAVMLFLSTMAGVGNGSTYRMIPAIFRRRADDAVAAGTSRERATSAARTESAATIGMAGAIGAVGGFALPRVIGDSIRATGGIATAFTVFVVTYAIMLTLTWSCYLRRGSTTGV